MHILHTLKKYFFLSVSGFTYNVPSSKCTSWAAKFSLTLYLIQDPIQVFIVQRWGNDVSSKGYWICIVGTIAIALLMIPITDAISRFIRIKIEKCKMSIYE